MDEKERMDKFKFFSTAFWKIKDYKKEMKLKKSWVSQKEIKLEFVMVFLIMRSKGDKKISRKI